MRTALASGGILLITMIIVVIIIAVFTFLIVQRVRDFRDNMEANLSQVPATVSARIGAACRASKCLRQWYTDNVANTCTPIKICEIDVEPPPIIAIGTTRDENNNIIFLNLVYRNQEDLEVTAASIAYTDRREGRELTITASSRAAGTQRLGPRNVALQFANIRVIPEFQDSIQISPAVKYRAANGHVRQCAMNKRPLNIPDTSDLPTPHVQGVGCSFHDEDPPFINYTYTTDKPDRIPPRATIFMRRESGELILHLLSTEIEEHEDTLSVRFHLENYQDFFDVCRSTAADDTLTTEYDALDTFLVFNYEGEDPYDIFFSPIAVNTRPWAVFCNCVGLP